MDKILESEGIILLKSGEYYYLQYDGGELMVQIKRLPITESEAKTVIKNPELAYDIIIKHHNKGEYGLNI